MNILSGVSDFFGLDIGTTAIRLVELHGGGRIKALVKYAYLPIDAKASLSDSKTDHQKLATAIKDLLGQAKVTTKNVAVGLPSQRVFTTVVDIDKLSPSEIARTIQYQADSLIPTPLSESKMEWAVLGDSPKEKNKVEVLISSISNDFVESRLEMLEAIGLNVIAFEPDHMALARAVIPADATLPQMVVDVGSRATDIVVSVNGGPRLARTIPTGSEAIIRAAVQNLNIDEKQAQQFVGKFGLNRDKLEGQIYNSIIGTIEILVSEIDKSLKFFQARYPELKIDRIILTGGASALPDFPLYIANRFNLNVEIGNAWRNVSFPASRQEELLAASNHFAVAAGLAERVE